MRNHRTIGILMSLLLSAAGSAVAEDLVAPLSDGTRLELPEVVADVPPPALALGYPLGARFTHWSEIVSYLRQLAAGSPRVTVLEYGRTWESRPLLLLAISSPENISRLEEVRQRNLQISRGAAPGETDPVVVWLGYGVHGNEPSSAEAAMASAYLLAAAGGDWPDRLRRAVVLIDPLANPDGRERYVHFFESRRGRAPDPLGDAAEHWEPWPGGRQNHYLVDLNRDWAWATQLETRSRLAAYRRWEPQVYVDFHEMSADSTYSFPPPAQPVNVEIGDHETEWARRFGRANAAAFDRYGWAYQSAPRYDLLYPGYGDSYPSLRGAVGMTYEMAGHGRAGEILRLERGDLLSLADRIGRHLTTSLATVATAAGARGELLAGFAATRRRAATGPGHTYLWQPNQPEAAAAAELLALHGAQVGRLAAPLTLPARPLVGGAERAESFPGGTWAVSTRQPLGMLIRSLMEPDSPMPEDFLRRQRTLLEQNRQLEFADITAWSIPLAYNLEVWVVGRPIANASAAAQRGGITGEGEVGYLAPPQGLAGFRLTAALMAADLRFRVAVQPLVDGGREYPAGTVFVPRVGNPTTLETRLGELAQGLGVSLVRSATAFSSADVDLGSDRLVPVRQPSVALVGGSGVSAGSYGAIWHLLDRDLELPNHRLESRTLVHVDLSRFDLLILPAGFGYDDWVDRATVAALGRWVEEGGLLVAVGGAIAWLRRYGLTDIQAWRPADDDSDDDDHPSGPANRRLHTPGAALATDLAADHPLAAGLQTAPAELFVGREILLATGDPSRDLLRAGTDPVLAGFAWPEAVRRLEGALLVGLQPHGKGAIMLFAQEPAFRLFWRAKLPLFLNAVMFGPSLNEAGRLTDP